MPALEPFRRTEYTGGDRCWRCTLVNLMLTAAAAILAYTAGSTFTSETWGLAAAAFVLTAGAAAIWLRGYLVPYTPALTRRYLPSSMLSWFGKADEVEVTGDVEQVLLDAEALRRPSTGSRLEVNPGFEEEWMNEIESLGGNVDYVEVLENLGFDLDEEEVRTFEGRGESGDSFAVEVVDRGAKLAKWPSRTALKVDLASANLLSARVEGWSEEPPEWRARMTRGLRLFLRRCPDGGDVVQGTEEVPSCCSRGEVVVLSCEDSGERLLEQEVRRSRL